MLAKTTEKAAIFAVFNEDRTQSLNTWWPGIKRGVGKLGLVADRYTAPSTAWNQIKSPAIVACGMRRTKEGERKWHWVVFMPDADGGLVYDPLRESPTQPSQIRRKPFSYLRVTPKQ